MKSRLYTRTGDKGMTSLVDGTRAEKDCERLEAYGCIDELSSALGMLAAWHGVPEEIVVQLRRIQNEMFEIGGYLATPVKEGEQTVLSGIGEETSLLENWIDKLDEGVPQLNSFILPGGTEASGICHLCRTICRRAERRVITLSGTSYVDPAVVSYLNRLSDYLFIAARYLNHVAGIKDIAWMPNKTSK